MARTYNQDCVLAYALDLLGERWTLLIVRELFLGPLRFGDLHAALPGLGTNLLSKRLKELEDAGLICSSGESRGHYRLSDQGEELRPAVREMMYWSIKYFMGRSEPSPPRDCIFQNDLQPDATALAVEMMANKHAPKNTNYVAQITIDENPYTFYFMDNEMTVRRGADVPTVARIDSNVETILQGLRGEIYLDELKERSRLSGDEKVLAHFLTALAPGAEVAFEVAELIKAKKQKTSMNEGVMPKAMAEAL